MVERQTEYIYENGFKQAIAACCTPIHPRDGKHEGEFYCGSAIDRLAEYEDKDEQIVHCKDCIKCGFCGEETNLEVMGFNGYCSRGRMAWPTGGRKG